MNIAINVFYICRSYYTGIIFNALSDPTYITQNYAGIVGRSLLCSYYIYNYVLVYTKVVFITQINVNSYTNFNILWLICICVYTYSYIYHYAAKYISC